MFENIGNTITHLPMHQLGRNLADRIPSRSWHVRRNTIAMATTQRPLPSNGALDIQQFMGIWRPNAWTNFGEIWYTTANSDNSDSHVINY